HPRRKGAPLRVGFLLGRGRGFLELGAAHAVNRRDLPVKPQAAGVVGRMSDMQETLEGVIERVTFHNLDSGFAVLRVQPRGRRDLVTVVGSLPSAVAGEF